ncbi:MAG: ATP synthase subunit C [Eubacteriales bacterium]|jgi:V/A-type H+-transporting ATPase subunit K|nr:ATP synthase subunit C [Eubacteriales bacterium]
MSKVILLLSMVLVIITPSLLHFGFKMRGKKLKTVLGLNIFGFAAILAVTTVLMFGTSVFADPQAVDTAASDSSGLAYIAAALVTGLASIGAGIAVASSASSAIGAISEDSSVMGKALIFVALAEGIALYGLLISFTILSKIG